MSAKPVFLDTNIVIYAYSVDQVKKCQIARALIEAGSAVISTQVLNEYCNSTRKKYPHLFDRVEETLHELLAVLDVRDLMPSTSLQAVQLTRRYGYSYYDSLILASALEAECSILVSEDMHNGMLIDERLRIVNPFLPLN